jgi:Flp pilus assembly pilin Flp
VGAAMTLINQALLRLLVSLHSLRRRPQPERGQTLAEYGLLLAVIAAAVVVSAVVVFRVAIVEAWDSFSQCLA